MTADTNDSGIGPDGPATSTTDQSNPEAASVTFNRSFQAEPLGYVDSLDGLRGYSMVVVMFYHARFTFFPGGFLAVSLFFTLSGFLITSLLLREWASDHSISMRAFWSRRFRRLLPASWVTLAAVVALGALGAWDADQLTALRGDIPFSLLQVVNWHYIFEQRTYGASFVAPSPVEHYWSLAVEEQFYLFLPLTILLLFKIGRSKTLRQNAQRIGVLLGVIIVIGAVLNGMLARNSIDRAYFGTDTRMPEMVAGGLLAALMARKLRYPDGPKRTVLRAVGVAGLIGIVALYALGSLRAQWMYPWGLLATSVTTCAIIAGSLQGGITSKILSFKPAAQLGRMSYGTYLVHWPVFLIITPVRTGLAPWPLFGVRFVVSVSISTLMFYYIEEPVRRRRVLQGPKFATVLAVALPAVLIASLFVTRNAEPSSVIQRDPTGGGTATAPVPTKKRVLVVGDQGATSLAGAVNNTATIKGKKVELVVSATAVPDCGLISGGWVQLLDQSIERDAKRCSQAIAEWTNAISKTRPDLVIAMASERDAFLRRADSTSPWAAPVPATGSDFTSLELGRSLDELTDAAAAVDAGLIVMTAVVAERDAPTPLPPPEPEKNPAAEELAALEEAIMLDSKPDPGAFASLESRVDELNKTIRSVAEGRNIQIADLGAVLTPLLAVDTPIDFRAGAPKPTKALRTGLTEWLAGLALKTTKKQPTAPPVPENLQNIELPPAPPFTPRVVVPAGQTLSMLVVGDSLAYNLGFGVQEWANGHDVRVANAGKFGCPIARGGRYRFQRDSAKFDDACDWGVSFPKLMADNRPEVVMLSSSVWQIVDRQLPGDSRYRHIGDEMLDRYTLSEFLSAVDMLASDGATVVLLTSAHIESGRQKGFSGLAESDPARMDRMNEIIREVVKLRPGVTKLIDLQGWLAAQEGREMDPARRPDGIHFTDDESRSIGEWLGPQLEAIGRGQ